MVTSGRKHRRAGSWHGSGHASYGGCEGGRPCAARQAGGGSGPHHPPKLRGCRARGSGNMGRFIGLTAGVPGVADKLYEATADHWGAAYAFRSHPIQAAAEQRAGKRTAGPERLPW